VFVTTYIECPFPVRPLSLPGSRQTVEGSAASRPSDGDCVPGSRRDALNH
jgi:hypothetical protein